MGCINRRTTRGFLATALLYACLVNAATYYVDPTLGSDGNTGTTEADAWATLDQVNDHAFGPGDQILLRRGTSLAGTLRLDGDSGSEDAPIVIGAYGTGSRPVIDAAGHLAGLRLIDASYVEARDLEITADGGATVDGSDPEERYGVYASVSWNGAVAGITLINLYIHDIYPEVDSPHEGANPTTFVGTGIYVQGNGNASNHFPADKVLIENCVIERVGHMAIRLQRCEFVDVLNNRMTDIGGPAIQPSRCADVLVEGNTVDGSGSMLDPRMHGRGSGIWPWSCERVVIQRNTFMNAKGREDSCGIHIDFSCRDVLVQYNVSINNAGGFAEILGNNYNCTYRYNISINDGWRVEDTLDQGTIPNNADGRIIFVSGWVGSQNGTPNNYSGPFNTYIYNNTVYVKPDHVSNFIIHGTARGLKVSNNIFYLEGPVATEVKGWKVDGDWTQKYTESMTDSVFWENNLYQSVESIPDHLPFVGGASLVGDPAFADFGALRASGYIPRDQDRIVDQGLDLTPLPGDANGVIGGLAMPNDIFGTPVLGNPDMGAVEIKKISHWLALHSLDLDTEVTMDFNSDGISLLEAFAFNLNPHEANAGRMPQLAFDNAEASFGLSYYSQAAGVAYEPQVSTDLQQWSLADDNWLTEPDEQGVRTLTLPLEEFEESWYLRIKLGLE